MNEVNLTGILSTLSAQDLQALQTLRELPKANADGKKAMMLLFGVSDVADLHIPDKVRDYLSGDNTDPKVAAFVDVAMHKIPRFVPLVDLTKNREFVCKVVDGEGNFVTNRYVTHYQNQYLIIDTFTGEYFRFDSRHYDYTISDGVIELCNKKSNTVDVITPDEYLLNGRTSIPLATTSSRCIDALKVQKTYDDLVHSEYVFIPYDYIVYGMEHGLEVLDVLNYFGVQEKQLHHIEDFELARWKYWLGKGLHPDRITNLALITVAEHIAYHQNVRARLRFIREAERKAKRELQRATNLSKLYAI